MTQQALISVRNVSKAFSVEGRLVQAVDNVSLQAREREFVALIGPSGCGKSTLLNLIAGLMEPDQGEIALRGDRQTERLGRIGYMPQRDGLLPWRRLLENVTLGPEVMRRDLPAVREQALALLPLFGLQGFERSYPHELSGGMRQRAALLRTLLCEQEVVLLDEPFGALDALTRRTMRDWLLGIWERFQRTMLLVTHDVDEALLLSDRIYVLTPRPGRVALEIDVPLPRPRHEGLLNDPLFASSRESILTALREHDG
ncbi:MAG: ABC transporter ATP-binding protein [Anaerolineae bacterium]|jgi:ABC-type nitrate/sulfonate/bicarbonate transport system ATPase subunit|nr:ABC transporter ATP-binding protein [Chloroflexota bacterium]